MGNIEEKGKKNIMVKKIKRPLPIVRIRNPQPKKKKT